MMLSSEITLIAWKNCGLPTRLKSKTAGQTWISWGVWKVAETSVIVLPLDFTCVRDEVSIPWDGVLAVSIGHVSWLVEVYGWDVVWRELERAFWVENVKGNIVVVVYNDCGLILGAFEPGFWVQMRRLGQMLRVQIGVWDLRVMCSLSRVRRRRRMRSKIIITEMIRVVFVRKSGFCVIFLSWRLLLFDLLFWLFWRLFGCIFWRKIQYSRLLIFGRVYIRPFLVWGEQELSLSPIINLDIFATVDDLASSRHRNYLLTLLPLTQSYFFLLPDCILADELSTFIFDPIGPGVIVLAIIIVKFLLLKRKALMKFFYMRAMH